MATPLEDAVRKITELDTRVAALERQLGTPRDPAAEIAAFNAAMDAFRASRRNSGS